MPQKNKKKKVQEKAKQIVTLHHLIPKRARRGGVDSQSIPFHTNPRIYKLNGKTLVLSNENLYQKPSSTHRYGQNVKNENTPPTHSNTRCCDVVLSVLSLWKIITQTASLCIKDTCRWMEVWRSTMVVFPKSWENNIFPHNPLNSYGW